MSEDDVLRNALERARWQQALQGDIGTRLERARKGEGATPIIRRAHVLDEVASTQDAPETMRAVAGTVVTTLRQTSGRGRLGRSWSDTGDDGIAITFVLAPNPFADASASAELLAIASAVAAAHAIERVLQETVGIKWPNDLVVDGRKLGGILIERNRDRTLLGIGINVLQREFPEALQATAISIAQVAEGVDPIPRLSVLLAIVEELEHVLSMSEARMLDEYCARDVLTGTRAVFGTATGTIEGEVCSVDPLRGLVVRTSTGEQFLPAATTSVLQWNRVPTL
ncbi:MAG: biotin--[acetyl-CoA-carboxylase] ligase [Phycisphaerales bacterium]|nr:biotin--[acetyl-CoA-carboxylase] ligase [Phycisphaerales bacterium]